MAKKIALFVVSLILFVSAIISARFFADKEGPTIYINETPKLSCQLGYDNLTSYASAKDESNVRALFVEQTSINEIIDSRRVTYVAVDTYNNVTKVNADVEISPELTTYHIETLKPLVIEKGKRLVINQYFQVENECSIAMNDRIIVDGLSTKTADSYEIIVSSKLRKAPPLATTMEVFDPLAPVIKLIKNEVEVDGDFRFSEKYFLDLIELIQDDTDSEENLLENLTIDYKEALKTNYLGQAQEPGTYIVTYTTKDKNKITGKAKLTIIVDELPIIEEEVEVNE